jgi:hypothetical protein
MLRMKFAFISFAVLLIVSCGGENKNNAAVLPFLLPSRSYYLGFTPFPYDISSLAAIDYVYDKIRTDADLIAHHFDNGIPWDEAFTDGIFPSKVTDDWDYRLQHTPAGHKIYVAVTPLNSSRSGLAPIWNSTGDNQPLTPPWSGYAFNHVDVKTAYLNYCRRVIDYFDPDYIAVGVEVNLLKHFTPSAWAAYLELHQSVYAALKSEYPSLPIFVTLTGIDLVEGLTVADHAAQMAALADIIGYTDYYGISFHPMLINIPADEVIPDWVFDSIFSLSSKPACITETSYPAETLTMTAYDPDVILTGSPEMQRDNLTVLLETAQNYHLRFVVNFLVRDYDTLWSLPPPLGLGSPEDILKAWRDTGFYDQDGNERPVLNVWREKLRLPVR